MKSIKKQIGGMYNTLFLLAVIGGGALLALSVAPVYMNEAKANKIVSQVAAQPGSAKASLLEIRNALQRRWDVDDVTELKVKDVKLKKTKQGKLLAYKYEVRKHLFANWDLVLTFDKSFSLNKSG
ncbi:MAG: DUF4845 domain-containing protein [Oceanococcus sp.]